MSPNRGLEQGPSRRVLGWLSVAPIDHPAQSAGSDDRFDGPAMRSPLRSVLALVCLSQALVLVGFSVFFVVEIVRGHALDPARAVMSVVMMLLVAAGLVALARGWRGGAAWQGTPTVLWHALLLPVAWSLFQAGQWGWFVFVAGAIIVVGFGVVKIASAESE